MKKLISCNESLCTGCNKCIRVCPIEGANVVYENDHSIKVHIDNERCIACGACIHACSHGSREYQDDTEKFLQDLRSGVPISMFAAPANRVHNGEEYGGRLLTWLRKLGVRKIYDVSLGADICTWAHIRYIQKHKPKSVISQPCPAIVNYVLAHNHSLIKYLSPIHSPMLCTAVYMRKYGGVNDKIAALSPCIAKTHEFEATGYVSYNVTLKKLDEYVKSHNIHLPAESSGFDHPDSALGGIYSMPGGLKENVELFIGKSLRIDQSEGSHVYEDLEMFSKENANNLPAVFDVLNCREGCNIGTGCIHEGQNRFRTSAIMDKKRQSILKEKTSKEEIEKIFEEFDKKLNVDAFVRHYRPINVRPYIVTEEQIEKAFEDLSKNEHEQRIINCGACGSDTCRDMARKVSLGVNIPKNCIYKIRYDINNSHEELYANQKDSLKDVKILLKDMTEIKGLSEDIVNLIVKVTDAIEQYNKMSRDIDFIASHINIISVNASIEAARAGIHGKSFAIIAEEIRNLAGSSQKTVGKTYEVSENASNAVDSISGKISAISEEIVRAHEQISRVYDNINRILKSEKEELNELISY